MKNNSDNQNGYINLYLKEAFSKLGKEQSEIIKDLGVSQSYVSNLMNGKKSVGKNMADKLVSLYGFDKAKILTGEGSMLIPQIEEVVPDEEEEESYLRTERNKYGLSLQDINEYTQISVKDLRLYDSGEKEMPKKVRRILEGFFEKVELEYENRDEDEERERTEIPILITNEMSKDVLVPYYDVDFAGGWSSEELFSQHKPSFFITIPDFKRAELACNLIGNSISQRIKSGSIIGLRKVEDWQTYFPTNEVYAVVMRNNLRTVKLVRRAKEKGFIELVPAPLPEYNDPPYQTETIPQDYIIEFYQVVATAIVERIAY
ncbi:helix-turn-helix transcriptional regulator [uncultured Capnocytophaga sp.]|uniref:XRE family transcriptional regulator n=1 Tax=uncultured Capnocytophaga sp. TaxID=159273 RepID=UPI0026215B57|nr:helix-turn-helix transcriptional regulator [uncultured Capnocytophaga sp.]